MTDKYSRGFFTPESFDRIKKRELSGPNGWLLFVACNAGIECAEAVKAEYEAMLADNGSELEEIPLIGGGGQPITRVFSDTETCPRIPQHVAGSNAFVFQCCHEKKTGATVNENLQQLLQVVRTLRAHRAETITVVCPYAPYSRQDKPSFMARESALASLFADQLRVAGADIFLTYHPHTLALDGFYEPDMKFVALSGLDLFIDMFEDMKAMSEVFAISTDAGGAKFTVHYAEAMRISHAIANKFRKGADRASLLGVVGELEGKRTAIVTDDETVTGNSLLNTVEALHTNYGIARIFVAVSHAKVNREHIPRFVEAHEKHGLVELHVTDTVPQTEEFLRLPFVHLHSLARRFAATINRLHYNQSVSEVFYRL